jgi:hypothetical protein
VTKLEHFRVRGTRNGLFNNRDAERIFDSRDKLLACPHHGSIPLLFRKYVDFQITLFVIGS